MNRLDIYEEAADTLAENGQFEPGEKEELKTKLGEMKVRQNILLDRVRLFEESPHVLALFDDLLREVEDAYIKILRDGNLKDGTGDNAQGALSVVNRIREVVPNAKKSYTEVSTYIVEIEDRLNL